MAMVIVGRKSCALGRDGDGIPTVDYRWISQRLKALSAHGKNQAGLARELKLPASRISEIVHSRRGISAKEAFLIARYLEMTFEEASAKFGALLPGYSDHLDSEDVLPRGLAIGLTAFGELPSGLIEISGVEFLSIGRYDAAFSAGPGCIIDPNAEPLGFHLIERSWVQTLTRTLPEHLAVVRVDNDSMEKTFFDGDWVLIDRTQTRLNREGVYGLAVGDATWIKRISLNLRSQLVRIISDNREKYPDPPQEMPEDELRIIGRVLAVVMRKV